MSEAMRNHWIIMAEVAIPRLFHLRNHAMHGAIAKIDCRKWIAHLRGLRGAA